MISQVSDKNSSFLGPVNIEFLIAYKSDPVSKQLNQVIYEYQKRDKGEILLNF
jgi:hypothetical protein